MIRFTMHVQGQRYNGFTIAGHAKAGAYGHDIVCAAVSSAAFLAANTLTEFVGGCVADAHDGFLRLQMQETTLQSDLVLKGLLLHMRELQQQYPAKIQIRYGGLTNASDKDSIIRT